MDKLEELTKIFADPFEFLKFVKIQEPGQLALDYELWPHLVDFYEALETYGLIDLIKSKKIGISWALAIHALRKIMTNPGWTVLEFSKGQQESQELLSKSRTVFFNLPQWIRDEPDFELEYDSTEKFGFKRLRSKIIAYPSTETAGVGETAGTVIHDESDFHEYYKVNLSHTRATVADTKGGQLISVSTVDITKPDSYFKEHWKAADAGKNGFKALFYGVFSRPGRGQAFYEQIVKENEATPWVVGANYPRTVKEALSPLSAQSCFKKERLESLWENAVDNPETRQNYIHILCPWRSGTQYVAGIDVGEGVGLDYSVLNIVGKYGLQSEVVAVIYTNQVGTAEFAYDSAKLCEEYKSPLLCVDNIGIGRAVIDKLKELGYTNLYYGDKDKKKAGWSLSSTSKSNNKRELVAKLVESIDDGSLITRFKPQIKELMEYQWIKGYPEPTGKTHGDTVISLMLANEMLKHVGTGGEMHAWVKGEDVLKSRGVKVW